MEKRYFIVIVYLLGWLTTLNAQDVGVVSIDSPVSGCTLSATENITVTISNYDIASATGFNVSYSINGGAPVVETYGGTIGAGGTATYTFTAKGNFSATGNYTIDANTALLGDINPANDGVIGYSVTSYPLSVGGTTSGGGTVCSSSNSGTITLTGYTGSIVKWQASIDGGLSWTNIVNTTASLNYNNLTATTAFRAVVQSGTCPAQNSTATTITVDSAPIGGSISGTAIVCASGNSGVLSLSGYFGTINKWQSSIDGGVTWSDIANNSTSQSYNNLTTTTTYRVEVLNGICAPAYSSVATITVYPVTVGGTSATNATVCNGSNSGDITLSGHTGSVSKWQLSTDGGTSWSDIINNTISQSYNNLVTTTTYRAVVQSGSCSAQNSSLTAITVSPASVGGSISSSSSVCSGGNTGTLTLSGHTGNVVRWQSSIDGGITWSDVVNTTISETYTNLTQTTVYRAVVQSGVCAAINSSTATITVNPLSVGGTVGGSTSVCSGSNSGVVTLSGHTGTIQNWESSTDGGVTWTAIANTTTTQSYTNIATATQYRAVVVSGTCAPATSSVATLTVDPASVGGTTSVDATVCSGSNSGTVSLAGQTGSILKWQSSADGGVTWSDIVNTTASQSYTNLTTTTSYRVVVQSGSCAEENSTVTTITVSPLTVAGVVSSNATVCSGANSSTLTLSGNTGGVVKWQSSTDNGSTWSDILNTTTSNTYTNITTTTLYRAEVQSGACGSLFSTSATITVDPVTVGGVVGGSTNVCTSSNSGMLTLSGYTGTVQSWESSVDGGVTWSAIANTSNSQSYLNLIQTTEYRAVVSSGNCPAANSSSGTITVDPVSVGGTVTSDATVCSGANSGTLTLAGHTGSIQNWESSVDGGNTWVNISNITPNQNYNNLISTTQFRGLIKNGSCPAVVSALVTITVDPATVAGLLSGDASVCSGTNSGSINLSGNTGNVINWESSTDGGTTWINEPNTTSTFNYTNLVSTTIYRAVVQSGVCNPANSTTATITVNPISVGGVVSSDSTVCSGSNSGILKLSGHTGNIMNWEVSTDNGNTWIVVANSTNSHNYSNVINSTLFRAVVQSANCPTSNSSFATITTDLPSNSGSISGDATVCESSNNGSLVLNNYHGSILKWQSSVDNGISWSDLVNTTSTQTYSGLIDTTIYRAIIQNGVCLADTTGLGVIQVVPMPIGGTVSSDSTVCSGTNSGSLILSGATGNIVNWEYSDDEGTSWMGISNSTTTQNYRNLTGTRQYRVLVNNSICPSVNSSVSIITVDELSYAGNLGNNEVVCAGSNGNTMQLSNYLGVIQKWQYSIDNGTSWNDTIVTSPQYSYANLNSTTQYQVMVRNGVCPEDTSNITVITVNPTPLVSFTTPSVCIGSPTSFTNSTSIPSGNILMYRWEFGDNNSSIAINPVHKYSAAGSYNVSLIAVSDKNCMDTAIVNVNVFTLPDAKITSSGPTSFCEGGNVTLSAPAGNTYLWNDGSANQDLNVNASGWYRVSVTNTSGCNSKDSVLISVYSLPTVFAGNDTIISIGSSYRLKGQGGVTYTWSPSAGLDNPNISNPLASPIELTNYVMVATDKNGCQNSDTIIISLIEDFKFTISNVITPNGDGFNDTWIVENIESYPNCELQVYNSYGNIVYKASNYQNNWDGTYNGKVLPDGTYYYIFKCSGSEKQIKGALSIIGGGK